MQSVLQDWVMELPLREQGTLLTAVRGCDDEPKQWTSRGIAESPGRRLTAFIRWCFMNPADVREVDIPGAFFQSTPPSPFKPSEFGHLPLHWYTHAMHALEVIGYRHPNRNGGQNPATQDDDVTDQKPYGDFSEGRFAWMLGKVKPLAEPVPAKGRLGLWEWEA